MDGDETARIAAAVIKYMNAHGGAAFPFQMVPGIQSSTGMTMREYYAGLALVGVIGNLTDPIAGGMAEPGDLAERAWDIADAMIAEKTKRDK